MSTDFADTTFEAVTFQEYTVFLFGTTTYIEI